MQPRLKRTAGAGIRRVPEGAMAESAWEEQDEVPPGAFDENGQVLSWAVNAISL